MITKYYIILPLVGLCASTLVWSCNANAGTCAVYTANFKTTYETFIKQHPKGLPPDNAKTQTTYAAILPVINALRALMNKCPYSLCGPICNRFQDALRWSYCGYSPSMRGCKNGFSLNKDIKAYTAILSRCPTQDEPYRN